ncbi:MAG: glycoside hydrolase family 3 C-terminal domain-containing protein, partial [Clostridia bacterium]|nr:glycoside hydrolase family 3 C-terminal domain-containing protein [Clostridia bacterium]
MKWLRHRFQPCLPLGPDSARISGCREHIALSRKAAREGMVLLKNEKEALPLKRGQRVVLLGKASEEYIKGGGGSGDVSTAYVRNLYDSMLEKEAEQKVQVYPGLHAFYKAQLEGQYAAGVTPGMTEEPALSDEQLASAAALSDLA